MTKRITPHMLAWREDPSDPDQPLLSNPAVQRLAAEIAPGATMTDLGGAYSLNALLEPGGLVLRVHHPSCRGGGWTPSRRYGGGSPGWG